MSKDYYKILGIDKSASSDEIKRAFRKLAHQHHPDKKGGNVDKFKEANEAYQVLSNSEKRKTYDQYGSNFDNMGAGGMAGGNPFGGFRGGGGGVNINMEDLGDIFGDMFGMGGTRTKARTRGADIEMNLSISFKESIFGAEKVIELYKNSKCEVCNGTGAEPGVNVNQCSKCKGAGKVQKVHNTMLGSFARSTICGKCSGEGSIPEKYCKQCSGTGARKKNTTLKVNIPAGINTGEALRVTGGGEAASRGGVAGDLYIHINVERDSRFTREGNDVMLREPLDFKTAVLGGSIEIETLDNKMKLKIPAGTQSGQVFRLRGKGVGGHGDMMVEVFVAVPEKLSRKQKKILEEWED